MHPCLCFDRELRDGENQLHYNIQIDTKKIYIEIDTKKNTYINK